MRSMRCTRSPNDSANPGQRSENQIHDRSHHENVERAVRRVTEVAIEKAKDAVAWAEKKPTDQAGRQKGPRHTTKAWNGNLRKKAENRGSRDVALHRKALQKRNVI